MADTATMNEAIRICIEHIARNMTEALRIARAAEACAAAGSVAQGVEVSMEIEQLLYETSRLHDAACLMNRISRT